MSFTPSRMRLPLGSTPPTRAATVVLRVVSRLVDPWPSSLYRSWCPPVGQRAEGALDAAQGVDGGAGVGGARGLGGARRHRRSALGNDDGDDVVDLVGAQVAGQIGHLREADHSEPGVGVCPGPSARRLPPRIAPAGWLPAVVSRPPKGPRPLNRPTLRSRFSLTSSGDDGNLAGSFDHGAEHLPAGGIAHGHHLSSSSIRAGHAVEREAGAAAAHLHGDGRPCSTSLGGAMASRGTARRRG